ncbi:hypothetical protein K3495_g13328, partial [Podosphaera aphanis]
MVDCCNVYNAPSGSLDPGQGPRNLLDLPECPDIVAGDFNIHHSLWDQTARRDPPDGEQLISWANSNGLVLLNPFGIPTHDAGATIDLFFTRLSPNACCEVRQDLEAGSDHRTLLTRISDDGPEESAQGRLHFAACDWPAFEIFLKDRLTHPPITNLDDKATFLAEALEGALRVACPRSRIKSVGAPWIEQVSNLAEAYQVTGWYKNRSRFHSPPLLGPEGLVFSPQAKAQLFRNSLLSHHLNQADIPTDVPAVAKQVISWPPLSDEEIYRSCCQVTSSAPGPDEITVNTLKKAWPTIGTRVAALFRRCDQLGWHPTPFKKANVIILPKSGDRNFNLPNSYRPIALLSCLGKGLERLIARRISHLALKNGILARDQCSAVPRRSAIDLTTALTCDIQSAWVEKKIAGIVTMDVKGAFDGIQKGSLSLCLRRQGWPENLVRWVISFMEQRVATISIDGSKSAPFPILCRLPQGSPVSPVLFLLAIEGALRISTGRLGYADDICIFASAPSLTRCSELLQKQINSTISWGRENGISFEISKTELQYFHRKQGSPAKPSLFVEEAEISPNNVTRWLGIFFDRALRFRHHITKACSRSLV